MNGALIDWTTTTTKNRLKSIRLVLAMESVVSTAAAVGFGTLLTPEAVTEAMHLRKPRAAELGFGLFANPSKALQPQLTGRASKACVSWQVNQGKLSLATSPRRLPVMPVADPTDIQTAYFHHENSIASSTQHDSLCRSCPLPDVAAWGHRVRQNRRQDLDAGPPSFSRS